MDLQLSLPLLHFERVESSRSYHHITVFNLRFENVRPPRLWIDTKCMDTFVVSPSGGYDEVPDEPVRLLKGLGVIAHYLVVVK